MLPRILEPLEQSFFRFHRNSVTLFQDIWRNELIKMMSSSKNKKFLMLFDNFTRTSLGRCATISGTKTRGWIMSCKYQWCRHSITASAIRRLVSKEVWVQPRAKSPSDTKHIGSLSILSPSYIYRQLVIPMNSKRHVSSECLHNDISNLFALNSCHWTNRVLLLHSTRCKWWRGCW